MKTFSTREEAAVWLIQNPGREVKCEIGTRYIWNHGGLDYLEGKGVWRKSTCMDVGPYTEVPLPEAEKTLEEKISEEYRLAFGARSGDCSLKFHSSLIRLAVEEAKKEGGK